MKNREDALQYFQQNVADHQLQVLRDDGVYRHLLLKKSGTNCYHFNIVTYPGTLVYTGDMGSFVFMRLEDMFHFFRADANHGDDINPGYWAEKLVAIDRSGHTDFDEEKFNRTVMKGLTDWIRENRGRTDKEERRELWEAVVSQVINEDSDNKGARKQIAAHDFCHEVRLTSGRTFNFNFVDFWENNFEDYTVHFYWACYAIQWAIKQYDEAKTSKAAA